MKKWFKALVAVVALVAMLTENTYSVYATMDGYTSPETDEMQVIEVNTEEAEIASEVEGTVADEMLDETVAEEENIEITEDTGSEDAGAVLASEDIVETSEENEEVEEIEEESEVIEQSLIAEDGKIIGEGYKNLRLAIEASDLADDYYYILCIDSDAAVEYDGNTLEDNQIPAISNKVTDIYLSNLENKPFEIYVKGENNDEIGAEYYVESVENGAVRMSINMDGEDATEEDEEETEEAGAVSVLATLVDEFGDEIGEEYKNLELTFDDNGVLLLDDIDNPPFDNFEIELGSGKFVKYTYKEAKIDGTIILQLRQQAKEQSEEDEETEAEYLYDYAASYDEWEPITEDTIVELVYSDGSKTTYEYEDDDVYVTATLQHANAIPDDAEFIVTPITRNSNGYNYDAYMDALNENAEAILGDEGTIDDTNVLLYDIGFFITDEDGNKVEVQPQEGYVSIKVSFKNNQLEEDINSGAEDELSVVHLPLSDEVKEEYATTEDATDITASDINVEILEETVNAESETAEFVAGEFSPYAFVGANGKMNPGTYRTFQDVLGSASAYGIVANEMKIVGHFESNFAVGSLSGGQNVQTCRNSGGGAGITYIGSYTKGGGFFMDANGNGTPAVIFTTRTAVNNMDSSMQKGRTNVSIDTTSYTEQQIKDKVKGFVNEAAANSKDVFNEASYEFSKIYKLSNGKKVIDLTTKGNGAGTYYIQFEKGDYAKIPSDEIKIIMNKDQTIIFNIPDESVSFKRYQITIKGISGITDYYPQADAKEDEICQRVIFNCPNAKTAETTAGSPNAGVFVVPNATFSCNEVAAGWVVADKIAKIGGQEWHCVYHDIPSYEPAEVQITARKAVDGKTPGSAEKFDFVLESYDFGTKQYTEIQRKQNNGGTITFDKISYTKEGTYAYRVREVQTGADDVYTYDSAQYIIHHKVVRDGLKYKINETNIYKGSDYEGNTYDVVVFNNLKTITHEFDIEKKFGELRFIGSGNNDTNRIEFTPSGEWPDGVSFDFVLKPYGGGGTPGVTAAEYTPMPEGTQGSGANRSKTIRLTKDNPTGSFGSIKISPNQGYAVDETVNGKHKVNCQILMWTIEEVVPSNKPVGVEYLNTKRYIKLFVDTYKESDGSYSVVVTHKESIDNNACCPHKEGPVLFANKYNPASLTVKKAVNDSNGAALKNNDTFYVVVYSENNSHVKTYYGTDGAKYSNVHVEPITTAQELNFTPLEIGATYHVIETDSTGKPVVTGRSFEYTTTYEGLGSDNDVALNSAAKKTVTITNTALERGKLTVVKKGGSEKPVNLQGVTFVLKEDDGQNKGEGTRVYVEKIKDGEYKYVTEGSTLQELVTDENGSISVSNLPIGKYYLTEKSLPKEYEVGYVKYDGTIRFEVKADGTTALLSGENENVKKTSGSGIELALTVTNDRLPAAIIVKKSLVDANGGSIDKNRTLSGFKFAIYDKTDGAEKYVGEATTDVSGKATFAGMLEYGHSYVIKEDADSAADKGTTLVSLMPSSFTIDAKWYENASSSQINSVTYVTKDEIATNTPVTGKIKLVKQNGNKETITEGEAWFVLSTSNNYDNTDAYVTVSGSNGVYSYAATKETVLKTVAGELTVDNLAPGTYYFFETKSPDATKYTYVAKTPYSFTINAKDGTAKQPVIDLTSDEKAVKVPNDTFNARLSFDKVNAYDTSMKLTSGTEFTLYNQNDLNSAIISVNATDGNVVVPFAQAAKYVLVETRTENGFEENYSGDKLKIYFEVTESMAGMTNLTLKDVNAYVAKDGRTLKAADFVDKNNNLVKNEPKTGEVTLVKRFLDSENNASEKYLGEASFTLWTNSVEAKMAANKSDTVINDAQTFIEYGKYTTDNQQLTVKNLPWGQYYFVETATVSVNGQDVYNYDKDEHYSFTIGKGQNGSLMLDATSFVTNEGETVTTVDNKIKTGSVKITKQDLETKAGISGIVFELYTADNKLVAQNGNDGKYITGVDGTIEVTDLEFGSYYFKESTNQTVTGYTFDTTTHYNFVITGSDKAVTELTYTVTEDGSSVNKTSPKGIITNKPIKGNVTLEKWAIANGTSDDPEYISTLEGAVFELYANSPSTIGQQIISIFNNDEKYYVYKGDGNGEYTTDKDGLLSVHDLPWGSYYFVETSAPKGYTLASNKEDRTFRFAITNDKLDVFIGRGRNDKSNDELSGKVPVNERQNGSVMLIKKDDETQAGIANVAFILKKDGVDYTKHLTKDNTANLSDEGILLTNSEGVIQIHDLPWGTYTFEEDVVPEGYRVTEKLSAPIIINQDTVSGTVEYTEKNTVTMFNTPIKGDLSLTKVNEYGNSLKGATFDLVRVVNRGTANEKYQKVIVTGAAGSYKYQGLDNNDYRNGESITTKIANFVKAIFAGNAVAGSLTTTDGGELSVIDLPYGYYEIYEITSPDGYEPNESAIVRTFNIGEKEKTGTDDAEVKFVNSKVSADVQFIKKAGGQGLNGSRFVLEQFDSTNGFTRYSGGEATAQTAEYFVPGDVNNRSLGIIDGVVSFKGLPVGRYRVYEVSDSNYSDAGNTYPYLESDDDYIWSVPNDDTNYYEFSVTMSNSGMKNVGLTKWDSSDVYDGYSAQVIDNKEREGRAKLLKKYGKSDLANAEFKLYKGTKDKNGYVYGKPSQESAIDTIESDTNGAVLTDLLPWGDYYLVESKAADSTFFLEENIDDRTQYHFTIGPDAAGTFNELITEFTELTASGKTEGISTAYNKKFYGMASFYKRDSETMERIKSSDVSFELWYKSSENGEYSKLDRYSGNNALRATDGKIETKKDLEAGWYYFIETTTAEGYKPLNEDVNARPKYEFTITQGKTQDEYVITWGTGMEKNKEGYYVTNTPEPGSIELLKFYKLDEKSPETALAGAEFVLVGKTDKGDDVRKTAVSNEKGEVSFTNLLWGTYSISEVNPPAGYTIPDSVKKSLPTDIVINGKKLNYTYKDTASLKIENERKPGKLTLTKVDDKDNTVPGVKFELQRKNGNNWVKVDNPEATDGLYETGKGGFLSIFNLREKKGDVTIENLEWGQYRLIERAVPEGYLMRTDYIPGADGVYVGAENMKDESHLVYDLGNVTNSNVHGNIGLKKIDSEGHGLAGAEFKLYQATESDQQANVVYVVQSKNGEYAYVSMDKNKAAETSEYTDTLVSPDSSAGAIAGKIKVTGLPCGTYYMQEIKEPIPGTDANGNTIIYQKNSALIGPFVVDEDQNADDEEQVILPWENGSDEFEADVKFYKTDAKGAGLDGVTYTIAGANSSWTVKSKAENDYHGVVRIHFTATGTYTIQETSTPNDAYTVDPNMYEITIVPDDNGRCIDLAEKITVPDETSKFNMSKNTFLNDEAQGGVKLVKLESESNGQSQNGIGGLNGVNFTLYYGKNRVKIGDYTTDTYLDEDGVIYVSDLAWGDYVFVENVPEGYTAEQTEYSFTIDESTFEKEQKIEVVTVTNNRIPGSLTLQKTFENPEEGFDGSDVEFTITLVEGTSDVVSKYTDTQKTVKDTETGNYLVKFSGLPWGIYTLTEGEPKQGYLKCTETKTVKIGNAIASESYNDPEHPIDASGIDVSLTGEKGILNHKIKGSVKFQKIESVKKSPLKDVEFKLFKGKHPISEYEVVTGNPVKVENFTDENGVFKTDKNGYVIFPEKSLEYGSYYLAEAIPEGYEHSTKVGDDIAFVYTGIYFNITQEAQIDLTSVMGHAVINTPEMGSVTLRKVDNTVDHKPLKGVEFVLYADDASGAVSTGDVIKSTLINFLKTISFKETESGTICRRATTDENGEIRIDGLPWGTYHFVETVPTGYTLSDSERQKVEKPFVLGENSGSVTLEYDLGTIVNDRNRGYVELTKRGRDMVTGENPLLPGAEFSLYKINGVMDNLDGILVEGDTKDTLIKSGLTTSGIEGDGYGKVTYGKAENEVLEWGQYYFVENSAPEGYDKSTEVPEILTVGILAVDGKNYTDVSVEPSKNFLNPSTEVTNNKGYGYTALYKEFSLISDEDVNTADVNTAVEMTDKNGTTTYLTFEVYKVDKDDRIVGSPVVVTDTNGNKTSEWIVNKDTMMTDIVGPLPYGKYAFVEKSIPSGVDYEKSNEPKLFTISNMSLENKVKEEMNERPEDRKYTHVVKFVNTTYRGWANIYKKDADATPATYVEGIDFDVYEVRENEDGSLSLAGNVTTVTTKEGGVATVTDLPLGKYAFVENDDHENIHSAYSLGYVASDAAYVFDITKETVAANSRPKVQKADKNADGTYTISSTDDVRDVENSRIKGSIELIKRGKNDSLLDGAVFRLYKVEGNLDVTPGVATGSDAADILISSEVETEEGTATITDRVTENGRIYVENLEWGTYYFEEVNPPKGYVLKEQNITNTVVIRNGDALKTCTVEMKDEPIRLDISKVDLYDTDKVTELKGAQFAIYELGNEDKAVASWTSDGIKSHRIEIGVDGCEGLVASVDSENPVKYVLKELTPPDSYTAVQDVIFSVDAYGNVTLYDANNNEVELANGTIDRIIVKDAPTRISIAKRELGTDRYLTGATLKVFDASNYKKYKAGDPSVKSIAEWTTADADNGSYQLSGKLIVYDDKTEESRNKSSYYLVETGVPAGYYKAPDVAFHITNDNKIAIDGESSEYSELLNDDCMLVMYDRPVYVSVAKKDTTDGNALKGAKLSIYDAQKNVNVEFTTDTKPTLLVPVTEEEAKKSGDKYTKLAEKYIIVYHTDEMPTRFVEGVEYTLHEVSAPEGYKLAADQPFKVNAGELNEEYVYETKMLDDKIKLYVGKYDMYAEVDENGERSILSGAKFRIYEQANPDNVVDEWASDDHLHLVSISPENKDKALLTCGKTYVLEEIYAPNGYAPYTETITFKVENDGSIKTSDYVMVNEEKIPKLSVEDEPLALCITKVDGNGFKLKDAELELRDGTGADAKTIAKWTSDGKIAFISQFGKCTKEGFTTVALTPGYKPVAGAKYYVYEVKAPTGYKRVEEYKEVTFKKLSESTLDKNVIKIQNSHDGDTSISGNKTWMLEDDLMDKLEDAKASIKIELYRYFEDEDGNKCYVGKGNTIVDKKNAVIDTKTIYPSEDAVSYTFEKLEKYYYEDETGKNPGLAHEYKFEVEENMDGLGAFKSKIISKKVNSSNNFINYQRYTTVTGDKKWILLKDKDTIVDLNNDETLRDGIFGLTDFSKSAYVDTNIILAVVQNGKVLPYDGNGDGKADYYVTIKYGAKDPSEKNEVEAHDLVVKEDGEEVHHVEIKWTDPGKVHFGFINLPMYDVETGEVIKYAFIENPVNDKEKDAYRVIYGEDDEQLYGTDGVTITNEPLIDPFKISGRKTWIDPFDNTKDLRPTIAIQLYRDDVAMPGYYKELKAADNYYFEFKDLYEYDLDDTRDGHKYTYEIKEVTNSDDYDITINFNGNIQRLEAGRDQNASVTNRIKPEKISISGTKTWNNEYNKSVPEVTFKLYATDSTGVEKQVATYVMKNGAGNTYKFTNLDKYDANGKVIKYRVEEDMTNLGGYISTPKNGYTIEPNPVRGADIAITGKNFVNTPSLIRVRKVDEDTDRALAGASLRVVDASGKTVDSWTTTSSDHYIEGLTFGETYTLEETEAPRGYDKAPSRKFTVNSDSIKSGNVLLVTMEDPKIVGKVSLTKRDADTREALSGASFNLYTDSGSLVHVTGSSGTYTYTEDSTKGTTMSVSSEGALTVADLPYGAYYFKETSAPSGYKLSSATEGFTIYENGATVDVTFLDEKDPGAAYLRKTAADGTTSLEGAVFELYSATPRTAGQAATSTLFSDAYYRYGTYTTGADGMISVDGLPWDDYYFIEVKAPDGYETNVDTNGDAIVYPFRIDSASAATIGVDVGTITNNTEGGGGGGTGVAGVRRKGGVLSDVLGVRAKPTSGVLGARIGPVTGDAANIALWLLLLVASISIIVIICIQNNKKKNSDK